MIINHTDCGMPRFTEGELEERFRKETGQSPIAPARFCSVTDAEKNTPGNRFRKPDHTHVSCAHATEAATSLLASGCLPVRGHFAEPPRVDVIDESPDWNVPREPRRFLAWSPIVVTKSRGATLGVYGSERSAEHSYPTVFMNADLEPLMHRTGALS
jgi:hypothetical protein